jgi:hypothetical protein
MGEVWKAGDTRLGRIVAIKLSKEQFSERFEREARAVAALNHPNICQLYDVGPNYLVMEYVEGETLKGPLKLDEAMPIIRQLIDGIEAAHERNIVHRDLKPANIKITPEGVVKILDFGLGEGVCAGAGGQSGDLANHHRGSHGSGDGVGNRGVHGSGTGAGEDRGQALRCVVVRGGGVRVADRQAGVSGPVCGGDAGGGDPPGTGLGRGAGASSSVAAVVPGEGPQAAAASDRGCEASAGGVFGKSRGGSKAIAPELSGPRGAPRGRSSIC